MRVYIRYWRRYREGFLGVSQSGASFLCLKDLLDGCDPNRYYNLKQIIRWKLHQPPSLSESWSYESIYQTVEDIACTTGIGWDAPPTENRSKEGDPGLSIFFKILNRLLTPSLPLSTLPAPPSRLLSLFLFYTLKVDRSRRRSRCPALFSFSPKSIGVTADLAVPKP